MDKKDMRDLETSLHKDRKGKDPIPKSTHAHHHHSPKNVKDIEKKIKDVVVIMADTVEKVLARESKLDDLGKRSENLEDAGSKFKTHAGVVNDKYRKYTIEMIVIVVILCVAFFAFLYFKVFAEDN